VGFRFGGGISGATAVGIDVRGTNHRSQSVAAGADQERAIVWYQFHDNISTGVHRILDPKTDTNTTALQKYSLASGALATATVVGGVVTGVSMLAKGMGYAVVPTVSFLGTGGSGATGTAVVDTQVIEVAPVAAGTGYSAASPPVVSFSGGGGSGAAATAVVDQWGQVTGYVVTNGGTGYTTAPTPSVPPPTSGVQATAAAVVSKVVASVTVTAGGTGYPTNTTAVSILPSDATALSLANFKVEVIEGGALKVPAPTAPSCRYRSTSAAISVAGTGSTPTIIKYETAITEMLPALYSTSSGQAISPLTGTVRVTASIGLTLTAGKKVEFGVYINNTRRDVIRVLAQGITTTLGAGTPAGGEVFRITGSYVANKGDTIDVRALTDQTTPTTTPLSTSGDENTLLIEFLR
jgi:hypothetical protein